VEIDYSLSEQACGFQVVEAPELKGHTTNRYYKGFSILKKVDARFIMDKPSFDWITGVLRSDSEILIGCPPDNYESTKCLEAFTDEIDEGTFKALDEDRNRYESDLTRKKMWYLLRFPTPPDAEGHQSFKLSVKKINLPEDEDDADTRLPMEYVPISTSHASVEQIRNDYAVFSVVRLDKRPGKHGNIGKPKMGAAARQIFERGYNERAEVNAQAAQQDIPKPFPNLPDTLEEAFHLGRYE
jgi:hypothetical protein